MEPREKSMQKSAKSEEETAVEITQPPSKYVLGPGRFSILVLILCSLFNSAPNLYADVLARPSIETRVSRIMSSQPLIDTHIDLPEIARALYKNQINGDNFSLETGMIGHVDIPRMREGKMGGAFWSVYTDCPPDWNDTSSRGTLLEPRISLQQIDVAKRIVSKYPKDMSMASSVSEFMQQWKSGKIVGVMGAEGLHQIGNSMAALRQYHALGVRYITLTHFCNNLYADSCSVAPWYNGLSRAGLNVIREMNRVGLIVDLSHTSADTQRQALESSLAPVIFSHSGARGLFDHERNAPDDVLYKLKENGGVLSIVFLPDYLSADPASVTIDTVVDHILYVVGKIGWKHVGIGSDYDGMFTVPEGLESVAKYPALIKRILERSDASDKDISNFIGGNILRVWRAVERQARDMEKQGFVPYEPDEL